MSRITLPYEQQNADVARCSAAGIDVISTAGFHHPACHGLAYAGPLLEACKRGGSTLAGVGLNPGFIAERVATLLTGLCAQLESVACYEVADASSMPAPEFVFGLMGFGADPAQRDVTREPIATMYGDLFMEVLHCGRGRTRLARRLADCPSTPSHSRLARSRSGLAPFRKGQSPRHNGAGVRGSSPASRSCTPSPGPPIPALHGASQSGSCRLAHRDPRTPECESDVLRWKTRTLPHRTCVRRSTPPCSALSDPACTDPRLLYRAARSHAFVPTRRRLASLARRGARVDCQRLVMQVSSGNASRTPDKSNATRDIRRGQ